ncbi:MAG: hypothetical protein EBR28_14645, partial [Planctomycetia bacterium]|nr:hypothetical protein [Planctomycetia bacterium]
TGSLLTIGGVTLSESSTGRAFTLAGTGNTTITGSIRMGTATTGTVTITSSGTTSILGAGNWNGNTTVGSLGGSNATTVVFGGASGANAGSGGAYILQSGRLILDNTGAGNNNPDRISNAQTLTVGAGSFVFRGSDVANSTETIGAIANAQGSGQGGGITVSFGGTNFATLTAASLSVTTGRGSILVNGLNLGQNSGTTSVGKLILTTAPTLAGITAPLSTGINSAAQNTQIVPWLVGESTVTTGGLGTATGTANTFLTYEPNTGLRPLNPTDEFSNNGFSGTQPNVYITANTSAASNQNINSLVINGGNLSIADGATVTNQVGSILFASSNAIAPAGTTGAL